MLNIVWFSLSHIPISQSSNSAFTSNCVQEVGLKNYTKNLLAQMINMRPLYYSVDAVTIQQCFMKRRVTFPYCCQDAFHTLNLRQILRRT